MQFRLKLSQADFVVELDRVQLGDFGVKRLDLARRDVFAREVVQRGDGAGIGGFERCDALDQGRHLQADQAQIRLTRRDAFQRVETRPDAAEAAVNRTQNAQDFGVGQGSGFL